MNEGVCGKVRSMRSKEGSLWKSRKGLVGAKQKVGDEVRVRWEWHRRCSGCPVWAPGPPASSIDLPVPCPSSFPYRKVRKRLSELLCKVQEFKTILYTVCFLPLPVWFVIGGEFIEQSAVHLHECFEDIVDQSWYCPDGREKQTWTSKHCLNYLLCYY